MDPSPFTTGLQRARMKLLPTIQKERGSTMNISTLGIDLAKAVFQLHGVNERGQVALSKRPSRQKLLSFLANLPPGSASDLDKRLVDYFLFNGL
jgi:hypothetical protein